MRRPLISILANFSQKQIIDLVKIELTDKNWKEKIENITQMKVEDYKNVLKKDIEII